ncbi:MAG: DUF4118 domain-containing protein, partial [Solobacterium sp.]|nr:DUF4118 domain-containing protein [Solobacterium sp.]
MNEAKQNNKRILICLSSSPSNARVIHAAAKLYDPQTDSLTALYIGSLEDDVSADLRLKDNILLARRCGAEVQIIESDDIVLTITGIARQMHTTDLFIGLSARSGFSHVRSIPERLIDYLPDTDIHIIPDARASAYPLVYRKNNTPVLNLRDLILVVAVMSAATLIGYWFDQSVFSNSNIVTIYILAVLIASVLTSHRVYGIIASILYILLFNFLFIDPRFTLLVYDSSYLVTYLVTFAASLLTGTLAVRLKNTARESSENAYQARILLETSDQMKYTEDTSEMIRIVCIQLEDLLKRPVSFFVCQSGEFKQDDITAEEKEILQWVADYRHQAGAYTDQWPSSEYRYLSVHSQEHCFGILRIDMKERSFTEFENTLLLSIINEFTLALTNAQVNKDKTAAEVNAEKERFRAGLLRSISHDLRTPLTSIIGNATNLVSNSTYLTEEEKQT